MGFGIGVGPKWARVRVSTRGVGVSAGPRIARAHVSNRGVGISTGAGPFSAWTSVRYPRINRITVGSVTGPRYLVEPDYGPHAVAMSDVTGLDALALTPTGPGDLVDQLNAADKFPKWTLLAAMSALLLVVGVAAVGSDPASGVPMVAFGALTSAAAIFLYRKESIEHLVPVEYALEGAVPAWTEKMARTWQSLRNLGGAWRIVESGSVDTLHQRKINAGASHLINRVGVSFGTGHPKVLTTNIAVPSLTSGRTTLYFLPDRVLLRTARKWSDVGYAQLRADVHHQRFIEDGRLPRDARQVDTTWRYVNKGGGPDRRFKDNRQLPVMLYGRVHLSSPQGLSWILDLSVPGVAESFASCLTSHPA